MKLLHDLADRCDGWRSDFEKRHSLSIITSIVDSTFPNDHIDQAIDNYRAVIRKNSWYFPTLMDVDVISFVHRWEEVHISYFNLAEEIFKYALTDSKSLADPVLLEKTIRSETMRGWVGRRSPSGLDALLEQKVCELEAILLLHLDQNVTEDVLSFGGLYTNDPRLTSAECEVIHLFATYHKAIGCNLQRENISEADKNSSGSVTKLLRGFCRYSVADFNRKYQALLRGSRASLEHSRDADERVKRGGEESFHALSTLVGDDIKGQVQVLLNEVRILNFINLNLEVKHSFKGWAGLMHQLVFTACSEKTGIDVDIYAMKHDLIKMGSKT
jgi:hypothetical protein